MSSKTFRVFSRAAAQTCGTTLEASTNPYRYIDYCFFFVSSFGENDLARCLSE